MANKLQFAKKQRLTSLTTAPALKQKPPFFKIRPLTTSEIMGSKSKEKSESESVQASLPDDCHVSRFLCRKIKTRLSFLMC